MFELVLMWNEAGTVAITDDKKNIKKLAISV
jgi:hypothetical protein